MKLAIDFDASRKVADDVDLELRRLKAEFEGCDRVAFEIAACVRAQSAAVADAIVDVTAREGAHRTKPMAEAQEAPWSLRRALGEFENFHEPLARELHEFGERIADDAKEAWKNLEGLGEAVWDKAKDVGNDIKHAGEAVWDKAQDVGSDIKDAGEAVWDKAQDAAGDAQDAVEDFVDDLTGKEPKKGARFRDPKDAEDQ